MYGNLQCKGILTFKLTAQSCVYISDYDGPGGMVEFSLSDSEDTATLPALGITEEITGEIGEIVTIVTAGEWEGDVDFAPGTVLYVDGSGILSDSAGTNVQQMGQVMKQGTTDGLFYVYGCGQMG